MLFRFLVKMNINFLLILEILYFGLTWVKGGLNFLGVSEKESIKLYISLFTLFIYLLYLTYLSRGTVAK